ncbi:rab effector MyRIP-like isoform X1, partial [Clarias magur]
TIVGMGRKLDMSNLTEEEAEHVLEVVQRDMQLRKTEEERLSELKQELDQEESRCVLLSRQSGFNERCCIRCCSSFTFFLKPRRRCSDCRYNVCKRCCSYSETDKTWLCSACEKSRLLKTQSLEWFYSNVRRRFNRFGSAKVLKMLYRRHVGDQGSQAEFTDGSVYAESTEDSVYESDTTFYKHTEERSMAESISVALRVAKEAIDEAITKAEKQTGNQEKLKKACYLRENRGELIEELTTMIVQTIICRKRDLSEMPTECNLEPAPDQNSNTSQSAFSLLTDEILSQHDKAEQSPVLCTQGLKKDDVSAIASWNQNVDWMENSCASSVLHSPDGNWFALQSTQQSRLSLPTKHENLMFSALEKESGLISAYDGMASETESDSDEAWGSAPVEIPHRPSSSKLINDHHITSSRPAIKLPTKNTADQPHNESDQNNPVPQIHKSSLPLLKRKVCLEGRHMSCQSHNAMGITTNHYGVESSEEDLEDNRVKRTRRRRRNKREATEGKDLSVCSGKRLSLSEPQDYGRMLLNYLLKSQSKTQSVSGFLSDETMTPDTPGSTTPDILKSGDMTPDAFRPDAEDPNHHVLSGTLDQQLRFKLGRLASQTNGAQCRLTSSGNSEVKEPVDERDEKGDKGVKKEQNKERKEALHDMEFNMNQEDSETKEDKYQNRSLPDVKDNEEELKKLCNSETLSTDFIDHLHNEFLQDTVENQSAVEMERIATMTQKVCFGCEAEIKREPKEYSNPELTSSNNIGADGQIKTTEDKTSDMSERMDVDQNVKQGKKDRSDSAAEVDTEPDLVKNQHSEGQRKLISDTVEIQECSQRKIDAKSADESKKDSVNNAVNEYRMKKEKGLTYSQENLGFGEEGSLGCDKMIENVVKGLTITEDKTEAHISNTEYGISDLTDESIMEKEEMGNQKEQNQTTEDNPMGSNIEEISRDEPTQENEGSGTLLGKTEELSCVTQTGQCNDHTLTDVLDCPPGQEQFPSPEEIYKAVCLEKDLQFTYTLLQQKYSAASLRSITTEVLKVLNATEDLIQGSMGLSQSESWDRPALPPTQRKELDEHLSKLEENVYVAASAVFGLEAELGDLEECARSISGETTEEELSHLEEQVASAAAQVQQSDLQVSDIAARIAALKNAGLNVAPQTRFAKPQTIDTSRQHRRRLPAPPMQ